MTRRRLVLQFGTAALALALSSSVALADSSTSGSVGQSDSQSSVSLSSDSPVTVQVSQTTSQTIGGDTGDAASTTNQTALITQVDPSSGDKNGDNNTTVPTVNTDQAAGQNEQASTPTEPVSTASEASPIKALAIKSAILVLNSAPIQPLISAVAAPLMITTHNLPPVPQAPLGFLDELHFLLSGMVVPAASLLSSFVAIPAPNLALLALLVLALIATTIPATIYTALLKRSGFLGAPRSDVGSLASLCHSTVMGFIVVPQGT